MIKEIKELPQGSRMVAYQLHERWNGSGYPRKRQGKQIHLLARIAGIADEFVAKISPRPYRPAMLPHFAMLEMVRGARSGMFDPEVIRALLHTLSLFPIGSFIRLSDGRIGKVIRSNGDDYTNPVVEVRHPDESPDEAEIIDLSESDDSELAIETALPKLDEQVSTNTPVQQSEVPAKRHGQRTFLCEGTYVRMSDERIGCVTKANAQMFSQPRVRVWSGEPGMGDSEMIDLADGAGDLHIACPISTPKPSKPKEPKKQLSLFGDDEDNEEIPEQYVSFVDSRQDTRVAEPMLAGI